MDPRIDISAEDPAKISTVPFYPKWERKVLCAAGYGFLDLKGIPVSFEYNFQIQFMLRNPGFLWLRAENKPARNMSEAESVAEIQTETAIIVSIQELDYVRNGHGAERLSVIDPMDVIAAIKVDEDML